MKSKKNFSKSSKSSDSKTSVHKKTNKSEWPVRSPKTSKIPDSKPSNRGKFGNNKSSAKSSTLPISDDVRPPYRERKTEGLAKSERAIKRRRVSFYTPTTFKGAQSKGEEAQLAEGTVQRIALEILNTFEETHDRIDHLLQQGIHKNMKLLEAREKGNLSKTVLNIIRWKLKIDYIISKSLKRDAESLDTTLKSSYRLATFNVVWMNKSAEKSISLSDFAIPKVFGKHKETVRDFIKFLNKAKKDIPYPNPKKNLVNALSITYSHPVWLVEKWIAIYGDEAVTKLCEFNNAEPALTLRFNSIKATKKDVMANLEREGFQVSGCRHAVNGFNVFGQGEIFSTQSFKDGAFEIQDESSQLFAAWCDPQPNHTVIDACAGAGGKSLYFSAAMNNKGKILATDTNPRALEKLRKRSTRSGSTNIEIVDLHAAETAEVWNGKADKVIIDAPCSGLGVLARNPDIKWRFDPQSFSTLAAEQITLLNYFARFVKDGGEMIYGTCTLNPDENENIIRHFLAADTRFKMKVDHHGNFMPFIDSNGFFYIKPFEHKLSGFFGCKLIRK
ncbi:class I SAM-dependent methyltransferase [bacterium]|nr:class I SAM-dependent methyltransferase [bacterium]